MLGGPLCKFGGQAHTCELIFGQVLGVTGGEMCGWGARTTNASYTTTTNW